MSYQQLSPNKLAFSFGLIWGLGMLLVGWLGWLFNYGLMFVHAMGSIYIGFQPSFAGGVIGAVWGFVDFFIFIWLCASVYNKQLAVKD